MCPMLSATVDLKKSKAIFYLLNLVKLFKIHDKWNNNDTNEWKDMNKLLSETNVKIVNGCKMGIKG